MRSRKKSRRIDSYNKPKLVKQAVKFPYKRVRIDWIDIITEGGWGSIKEFKDMKLATPVSEGWLFSKDEETVRIFAGYDVDDDGSYYFFGTFCFSDFLCEEDNEGSLTSIASTTSASLLKRLA
jgi:hypothetical protein